MGPRNWATPGLPSFAPRGFGTAAREYPLQPMSTPPKTAVGFHLVLVLGVAAVTAAFRIGFKDRHERELRTLIKEARYAQILETEKTWKAFPYFSASKPGFERAFMTNINFVRFGFPNEQRQRLEARVAEVLRYLTNPNFDEYYRLKTEGLRYRFTLNQPGLPATNGLQNAEPWKDLKPREGFRQLWISYCQADGKTNFPRLVAICNKYIGAATNGIDTPAALLKGEVRQGFTGGREAFSPGFEYQDTLVGKSNAPLYFQLSFFAKVSGTDAAGPFYLSLRWVSEDRQWALNHLITDVLLGFRTLF
jgi:hypothetical protein